MLEVFMYCLGLHFIEQAMIARQSTTLLKVQARLIARLSQSLQCHNSQRLLPCELQLLWLLRISVSLLRGCNVAAM